MKIKNRKKDQMTAITPLGQKIAQCYSHPPLRFSAHGLFIKFFLATWPLCMKIIKKQYFIVLQNCTQKSKKHFSGRGRSQSSRGISSYRGGSSNSSRTVYRKTNRDGSIVTRPAAMHVDEYQKAEEGDSDHEKGKKKHFLVVLKPVGEIKNAVF